jgi:transposase
MLNEVGMQQRVYLACGSTDMRKSIDGLAALVQECFLKILHWQHNGFWLYYRRLERGRFEWPGSAADKSVVISRRELNWLLDGLSLTQPKAHPKVSANRVV